MEDLVFQDLAETSNEKEITEKYGITIDDIVEIMLEHGYTSCQNCSTYVEMGGMITNPEDDSEQACDACASGWGW